VPYVDEDNQQSVDDHLYGPPTVVDGQCLDDTGPPAPGDANPQCTDDYMPEPNPNPVPDNEGGAGGSGSSFNDCHPSGPDWIQQEANTLFGTSWGVDPPVPGDCPAPWEPPAPAPYERKGPFQPRVSPEEDDAPMIIDGDGMRGLHQNDVDQEEVQKKREAERKNCESLPAGLPKEICENQVGPAEEPGHHYAPGIVVTPPPYAPIVPVPPGGVE